MKYLIVVIFCTMFWSCATKNIISNEKRLFEILSEQPDGGANIEFFELITESNEINMLLNDDNLKNKIIAADIKIANFVIINAGKQNNGNTKIEIEKVEETVDRIFITVKKQIKKTDLNENITTVQPYLILKINSKKQIDFR